MEIRDTHILSSMWRVYYHTRGHKVTARVIDGWIGNDWVSCHSQLERCMPATFREGDVSSDTTAENSNWWLHATATIIGVVSTVIFTFSSGLLLYIPAHNKVEPWDKLCETVGEASRYTASVRSTIESGVYAMVKIHESDRVLRQFRYEFLPNRKPIIARELAYDSKYMSWFRHHIKSYLLEEEARGRQRHTRRPRQVFRNPRFRVVVETVTAVFSVLHTNAINVLDDDDSDDNTQYGYTLTPMVLQTPLGSLFYQGEPSFQPPVRRMEDTRWQPKSNPQSTGDKGKEDDRPIPQCALKGRVDNEDKEVGI
ncbi:hypothetical protein CXB51_018921 [Gossypium anomalum]|uniref:Aminotransferase-like plant mobile domain-containing protein n=1 Tax=Gossypium anomalum TaxID=47600 RepID=A0A8J5YYT8_9ROSI|nr:hypothetical protein CXB51_018921 [Gossypium anomalum]